MFTYNKHTDIYLTLCGEHYSSQTSNNTKIKNSVLTRCHQKHLSEDPLKHKQPPKKSSRCLWGRKKMKKIKLKWSNLRMYIVVPLSRYKHCQCTYVQDRTQLQIVTNFMTFHFSCKFNKFCDFSSNSTWFTKICCLNNFFARCDEIYNYMPIPQASVRLPGFTGKSELGEGTQIPYCNHLTCIVWWRVYSDFQN